MQSLEGRLLVAAPDLLAPMFEQSVVLLISHDEEGATGVILNKPTTTTMTELSGTVFDDEFEWDEPLYLGGPVQGPLAVLHTIEAMADREVIPEVYLTLDAVRAQHLLSKKPQPCLAIANYSGWGPGQLEEEIQNESWSILPARFEHIFWSGPRDLWESAHGAVKTRHVLDMLGMPETRGDPSMN